MQKKTEEENIVPCFSSGKLEVCGHKPYEKKKWKA